MNRRLPLVLSLAVSAARSAEVTLSAEVREVAQVSIRLEDDVATVPPVTAVRPALRHVLLTAEADCTVAAAARLDVDACAIREHGRRGRPGLSRR